ncbi:MAG TPA: CBS domain-containing protein [Burkholderiaceae bacterium]|nr:CBS domain-containing protein [Burkholderiaceae bacterium]
MKATDIMTVDVITASPDDSVQSLVEAMLENRISALPVVDAEGRVLGIVSEGDLMNRPETQTRHKSRSWWLHLLAGPAEQANDFLKIYGSKASDVMTAAPVTATEDETPAEIAQKLERHRIKRVPIVRDGKLVGIVSRANLLRSFGQFAQQHRPAVDAATTREAIMDRLNGAGIRSNWVNVIVTADAIELWGAVEIQAQVDAAAAAARSVDSSRRIVNYLAVMDRQAIAGYGGV